jgi:hypothetical protein
MKRSLALCVLAGALVLCARAQDAPGSRPDTRPPLDKVAAIQAEYDDAVRAFSEAYQKAETDAEKQKLSEEKYPKAETWFPRLLEIGKSKDPVAAKALVWIVNQDADSAAGRESLGLLLSEHAASPDLKEASDALVYSISPEAEKFLRTAMEKSPHDDVKARASYALAQVLRRVANVARRIKDDSDPDDRKNVEKWYAAQLGYLGAVDSAKAEKEAEDLLVAVKEKHGTLEAGWGGTLADRAGADLFEMRNLAIGNVAPEITGEDIFGKELKLSDFKGRVVVVDFWGHW